MILVNGGSSSGKSAFAESLIVKQTEMDPRQQPSWYLATMIAWDEECRERIRKHREMRAKKNFMTIECPRDLSNVEVPAGSRCLLECVSNLAANEMYRQDMEDPAETAKKRILEGIKKIRKNTNLLVIVTNDVSGDQGPYSEETEEYRELLGGINCALADEADEVYEVICGEPVAVKRKKREDIELEERKQDEVLGCRSGITLFVGGAYQGKAKLAMREAVTEEEKAVRVADGEQSPFETAFDSEVIFNLHMYIRRLIETENGSGEKQIETIMYSYLDDILYKNPNVVITCDEIGCGIVPIDRTDRLWREMTGDACQYLAARAAKVCRVVCGIPMLLKGGEA